VDRRSEARPQYLALSASPDQVTKTPSRNILNSRLTTTSASTAQIHLHSTSTTTPSSAFTHTCSQSLPASIQSHSLSLIGLCLCICTELVRSLRRGVVVHQPTLLATATIPAPLSFMQRLSCLPNLENVVGASLRSSGTKPPL
jgi:hypothetical protein